jgi:NTP pyrophosphatase (non-canonical NTP hydrolase)
MLEAAEPYTLALFTRILKWTNEECQELIEGVKREILDRSIHMYGKMYFVYGRKP